MTDHTDLVRRLQARLAEAEADSDRLAREIALMADWHPVLASYPATEAVVRDALRLHDEAVARRQP